MMNDDGDHDGMMVIDVMGECNCNNEMIGGVDHTRMLLECIRSICTTVLCCTCDTAPITTSSSIIGIMAA